MTRRSATRRGVSLPLLVAADEVGARIAPSSIVARRCWSRTTPDGRGGRPAAGFRPAVAIAIDRAEPDRLLYASESRLFLSEDGGRFWRALTPELIGITAVEFS